MTPPAPSSISPSAPTPRSEKATKNPVGSKRGNLIMSSSGLMNRRRWPISTKNVFELFEVKEPPLGETICLSDGKVRLLIQPTNDNSYMSMRQGLDHIGYKVESIEQTKKDLEHWPPPRRRRRQETSPAASSAISPTRHGWLQDRPVRDLRSRRRGVGLFRGLMTTGMSSALALRVRSHHGESPSASLCKGRLGGIFQPKANASKQKSLRVDSLGCFYSRRSGAGAKAHPDSHRRTDQYRHLVSALRRLEERASSRSRASSYCP